MPVFGFNTEVSVGNQIFHVQTEDRGRQNPVLDTTIYQKGRVLAKRCFSYKDFLESPDFNEEDLHELLERQHKRFIEEVHHGQIKEMEEVLAACQPGGISVQLMNPSNFLQGGQAILRVAVTKKPERIPLSDVEVRVEVDTGGPEPVRLDARTDANGKLEMQFPLPRLGPGGAALLIHAEAPQGHDEIKYNVKAKPKTVQ